MSDLTRVEGVPMADQRSVRRSGGLLGPVVGGLVLIGALIAVIAFRNQLWQFLKWVSHIIGNWVTVWAPAHQRQTGAIAAFAILALALNWIAHVRGRLRAWIFALVVEIGLWLLFWNGPGIPSLNDLLGFKIPKLNPTEIVVSGALVIAVTGVVFWFLELRESWRKYLHQHSVDAD
jgi:hypothetical protein